MCLHRLWCSVVREVNVDVELHEHIFGRGGDMLECADIEPPFKLFWVCKVEDVSLEKMTMTIPEESELKLRCYSLWPKFLSITITHFE